MLMIVVAAADVDLMPHLDDDYCYDYLGYY